MTGRGDGFRCNDDLVLHGRLSNAGTAWYRRHRAAPHSAMGLLSTQENMMSRSSDDTVDPEFSPAMDQEIAALLSAIEREKVPDRLTRLAMELQHAL
ncbi:hypothetical protein, partial [Mesorhizobium sp. ES1-4]|uniref:hypothetical protein n=1 Tax=Mesorhizobium sp. ES1-4 TaxID=2876627 RepID=UPI001CCAE2E4